MSKLCAPSAVTSGTSWSPRSASRSSRSSASSAAGTTATSRRTARRRTKRQPSRSHRSRAKPRREREGAGRAVREAGGRRGSLEARRGTYRASESFDVGERVEHPSFGQGVVEVSEPGKVTVFFATGRRVLVQAKEGRRASSELERPEAVRSLEHRRRQAGRRVALSRGARSAARLARSRDRRSSAPRSPASAIWYMRPRAAAGRRRDRHDRDRSDDSQLVVRAEAGGDRSFLELSRGRRR